MAGGAAFGFEFSGGRAFAGFEGAEGLTFLLRVGNSANGVNPDQSVLGIRVERKTAPGPVLGMIDQFSFQRIHVHVVEFFDPLLQTPYVEIIEAALPKARQRIVATGKVQIQLSGDGAPLAAQAARDALFQHLNHGRGRSLARLADEQRDVLRHDYVAHQGEAIAIPHLTEDLDENISGANRAQQGQASIASERNEMQMTVPVVANEFVGHGTKEKSKPRTSKNERGGHPGKRDQFLGVDVLEWYHAIVIARQQKKRERVAHPPGREWKIVGIPNQLEAHPCSYTMTETI